MTTSLKYADQYDLATVASSTTFGTERSYRLNSLYDPDFTSTGHQPLFYDQIAAAYMRSLVNEVDVKITFSDPSADGLYVACFIKNFLDTNTLGGATISQACERPTVWLSPLNNTGSQVKSYSKRIKIWELMGLSKAQYEGAWPTMAHLNSANPAISPYLSFAIADASGGTQQSCRVTIELTFHCQFFGRNMVAQS